MAISDFDCQCDREATIVAAGAWTELEIDDLDRLGRWVEIMRQMHRNYLALDVNKLRHWMISTIGETWYFESESGEISLRFQYVPKRSRWQLYNVGFMGSVAPAAVVELVGDKTKEFMLAHGIDEVFALRPKRMDNPQIEEFHSLVPSYPKIVVSTVHDVPSMLFWTIVHREARAALQCKDKRSLDQTAEPASAA